MPGKYDHKAIEKKWQKKWENAQLYKTVENSDKEKAYVLDMFPYPSGEGLHVGHPKGYIATDVYSRYQRMRGKNVLHPMGWDAFGLPAENYALKNKVHPRVAVEKNIANFKSQLSHIGFDYDWSREINTTDPAYYKWTQWIFLQLFKKGLAYQSDEPINWCPSCMTGLANEDLDGDVCERCGSVVEKRRLPQWVLKITEYADRMLTDLDSLNWPEHIKEAQRNWIGRSEGAEIIFQLTWPPYSGDAVFASNNDGKLRRLQKLIKAAGLDITLKTPKDIGVDTFSVAEDASTLEENAEKKARSLAKHTTLPVIADDTGFFIEDEKIDPVTVKRNALNGEDENKFTVEEIASKMQAYYVDIARKHGGRVDAYWKNAVCVITPDKIAIHAQGIRPVILTDEVHGIVDPHLPVRGLYISKASGKYALEQNEQEELKELQPITDAVKKVFTPGISVFTTRPDTLFGATYIVLSPEHPFVKLCIEKKLIQNVDEVRAYMEEAKKRTEIERTAQGKEKTGVELKGVRAINPASKEEIPMFIADYVLGDYGTGAIMAVPAHDERDYAFAKKFGLPIRQVIKPIFVDKINPPRQGMENTKRGGVIVTVKHWSEDKYLLNASEKFNWKVLFTGGIEDEEAAEDAAKREITEETGYKNFKASRVINFVHIDKFFAQHKNLNREVDQVNVLVELADGERIDINEEEKALHQISWKTREEMIRDITHDNHRFIFEFATEGGKANIWPGFLMNSEIFDGLESEEAKKKITEAVGGKWTTTYKIKNWVFSRQRYWGEPIPIIHCPKDGAVAVQEKDLPVLLPEVESYEPSGNGESPLANITEWVNTACPTCGGPAKRETNTMPQWAGSSWYYLRFMDSHNNTALVGKEKEKYWAPVDVYVGGDHAVRHLIYARFWHKFLYDIGTVSTLEPFTRLEFLGFILAEDGRKMSKRYGNVINPDDVVATYGADAFRTYEMFMGPFENTVAWSTASIAGTTRFIERVWRVQEHVQKESVAGLESIVQQSVKKVGDDIEAFKFNTAVSQMMILLNAVEKEGKIGEAQWKVFLKLLAPFAPHVTEELWAALGNTESIHVSDWPLYDASKITAARTTIAIQVNGKVRGSIELSKSVSEEEALAAAREAPGVARWLALGKEQKTVYVAGRIVSFVVSGDPV